MKPRTRSLIPASIGSNQASPANRSVPFIRVVVLSCSMAWSPPARQRRSWLVEQAGGYAKPNFHHIRDGTRRNHLRLERSCDLLRLRKAEPKVAHAGLFIALEAADLHFRRHPSVQLRHQL